MLSMILLSAACLVSTPDRGPNSGRPLTLRLDPPIPEEDPDLWSEELQLLLEYMCIILNCNGARDSGTASSVQQWVTTYQLGGIRRDMSIEAKRKAIGVVSAMRSLAVRNPGVITADLCAAFVESLDAVLEELGQ